MLNKIRVTPLRSDFLRSFISPVPARLDKTNDNRRSTSSGVSSIFKIVMDRVGALCALTLLSPVFLALALIVKRDGGPAFYSQRRIGENGRPFKCWKFRSMVTNSAEVLSNLLENSAEARAEWERAPSA